MDGLFHRKFENHMDDLGVPLFQETSKYTIRVLDLDIVKVRFFATRIINQPSQLHHLLVGYHILSYL